MTKNCLQCKNDFIPCYFSKEKNEKTKFCSLPCYWLFSKNNPNKGTFKKGNNISHEGLKGSDNPSWKGGNISLTCKICSKPFEVCRARSNAKTCSRECSIALKQTPENREKMRMVHRVRVEAGLHNLYRGVTELHNLIRKTAQYKLWRKEVYEHDGYACQECGVRGVELQADHIRQFAIILFENNVKTLDDAIKCAALWDITNGRTLCVPHHRLTNTWGVRPVEITR